VQQINRVVELGFLQRLKGQADTFEVKRILKTFIDAQWLNEFGERLAEYRKHAEDGATDKLDKLDKPDKPASTPRR